jgi:type I restriction enzyme S subunit
MKSNYKRLGDYIVPVKVRNSELKAKELLGININKYFMPSVANIVGTDLTNYKLVQKNQFACNRMHVGRDYRIPVAVSESEEPFMVSPAYDVFEVMDNKELLPEYLMMWFERAEFDRNAWFYTDADVRGGLAWHAFEDMQLPIPHIDKQREIVKEYNIIQNRIALNQQLIQKLEEAAQAIYREWFEEFEFPDENGKPYKSNGGEMVWCEELGKEIPKGWEIIELKEIMQNFDSKRKPLGSSERINRDRLYPYYGAASLMDYIDDYIFDGTYILLGEDGTVVTERGTPVLQYVWGKFWVNNHAHVLKGKNGFDENSLYILLSNTNITDIITGGVQAKINQANLNSIPILRPNSIVLEEYNRVLKPIFELFKNQITENFKLTELKALLLSKLATLN